MSKRTILHIAVADSPVALCGAVGFDRAPSKKDLKRLPTCTPCARVLLDDRDASAAEVARLINDVAQHWQHTREQSHLSALALYDRTMLAAERLERQGLIERHTNEGTDPA